MDITKLTVEQLKVLAYEMLKEKERILTNLALLENEIAKRQLETPTEPPTEPTVETKKETKKK